MNIDSRFINIVLLGFGFMFIFTAFQTMGNIQQTVLNSFGVEYEGAGYTSLAIIYAVFATSNWLAPSVVSMTSPKIAMVCGGIFYTIFIFSFLLLKQWLLYVVSVIIGIGAALIWTGQGTYMILNSDERTMSRNAGVFWAMVQCSLFFGNLFVYFQFKDSEKIDAEVRNVVFIVLGVVSATGIVFLAVLRPAESADGKIVQSEYTGPVEALKSSLRLFTSKQMMLLLVTFFYTGIELSFFSGVYGTSIANTLNLGADVKSLVGLSGVFVGVGEVLGQERPCPKLRLVKLTGSFFFFVQMRLIRMAFYVKSFITAILLRENSLFLRPTLAIKEWMQRPQWVMIAGGLLFSILGSKTIRWGRDPIVIIGFIIHVLSFFLIFINLPNMSPVKGTTDEAFIESNRYLALFCSFLLGFGDSCFNTQIYTTLGNIWSKDSAPAVAIFKFTQSVAAAASFFYSLHATLQVHLGILLALGTVGTVTYCLVEWMYRAEQRNQSSADSSTNNSET